MNNCVLWNKSRNQDGYGHQRFNGQVCGAHRVAWQKANGPIPKGMLVLHKCDNPPCVNVDHLFLGTHADNKHDCMSKGRHKLPDNSGEKHGMSKLSNSDVRLIKTLKGCFLQREIGAMFGVDQSHISDIHNGWRRRAK